MNIWCIDSEIVENSGSDQKNDCLRKDEKMVFCLCMNWNFCDFDQTTGKQRAPKMIQNQWKKRDNEKQKIRSSVYAQFEKSEISNKVSVNRMIEKSSKTLFLILHCWEAFMNLIAGSLRIHLSLHD